MSDLTPKGFSNGQYVDRFLLRDKLYAEDAITMKGVAILNEFPAADVVEREKGKWTYQVLSVPGGKGQTYAKWRCSRCRMKFKNRSNYCPNCGADLRENKP